jgi:hypothetical protein
MSGLRQAPGPGRAPGPACCLGDAPVHVPDHRPNHEWVMGPALGLWLLTDTEVQLAKLGL